MRIYDLELQGLISGLVELVDGLREESYAVLNFF
jgi:hypothetical protein